MDTRSRVTRRQAPCLGHVTRGLGSFRRKGHTALLFDSKRTMLNVETPLTTERKVRPKCEREVESEITGSTR